MRSTSTRGTALWAAALLAVPGVALAQDNALNNVGDNVATTGMNVSNGTAADPAVVDPMANDLGAANGMDPAAMPMDNTVANDMALANSVPPEREEDNDFPWGLIGLLGLAGLMGRKKNDIHVDNRTDRRDV